MDSTAITENQLTSHEYCVQCRSRGLMLFVNNYNDRDDGINQTVAELENLSKSLTEIDFELFTGKIYKNLPRNGLLELCEIVSREDFTHHSCLLVVFTGRGKTGLLQCGEELIELSKLMEMFQPQNCPSLVLKPKIFIVQTMEPLDPNEADAFGKMEEEFVYKRTVKVPRESDFLTYTSDVSFYLFDNGFLKAINEQLQFEKENRLNKPGGITDIQRFLISINCRFKTKCPGKPIPVTMSSLTKRFPLFNK